MAAVAVQSGQDVPSSRRQTTLYPVAREYGDQEMRILCDEASTTRRPDTPPPLPLALVRAESVAASPTRCPAIAATPTTRGSSGWRPSMVKTVTSDPRTRACSTPTQGSEVRLLLLYTGVRGQTAPPLHRVQRSDIRRNLLLIYTEVRGQTSGGTCSSSSQRSEVRPQEEPAPHLHRGQRSDLRRNLLLFHTEQQELHVTQEEVRTCSSQEVRTCSSSTGEGQNLLLTGGGQNLRRNLIHKRGTSC